MLLSLLKGICHFRVHCASVSKRVFVQNLSYEMFDLHENENEPVGGTHFRT